MQLRKRSNGWKCLFLQFAYKKSIYNQTYATPFCKTKTLLRNKDVIACTILCEKNQLRKTKRMR